MSLATNVSNLATAIATEMKSHKTLINGNATDLAALTTTSKTNLVSAINEVRASVSGAAGINDTTASTSSTYSSSKVNALLASGSTADRDRANHTGSQSADTITTSATKDTFLLTERTKLTGIATGATANSTDTFLRDRANHTGTQLSTTISDFVEGVQDVVGGVGFIVNGTNITATYNDAANTLTIATSATVNATDAALRDRSTHTGTQAASTITGLPAALIDDTTPSSSKAYSSTKTDTQISAAVSALVNSAPGTLDTLGELATALQADQSAVTSINTALGNRLRFDAAQTLTGPQQTQGLANLGAAAAADLTALTTAVGDTTTNFVTVFNAGLV